MCYFWTRAFPSDVLQAIRRPTHDLWTEHSTRTDSSGGSSLPVRRTSSAERLIFSHFLSPVRNRAQKLAERISHGNWLYFGVQRELKVKVWRSRECALSRYSCGGKLRRSGPRVFTVNIGAVGRRALAYPWPALLSSHTRAVLETFVRPSTWLGLTFDRLKSFSFHWFEFFSLNILKALTFKISEVSKFSFLLGYITVIERVFPSQNSQSCSERLFLDCLFVCFIYKKLPRFGQALGWGLGRSLVLHQMNLYYIPIPHLIPIALKMF